MQAPSVAFQFNATITLQAFYGHIQADKARVREQRDISANVLVMDVANQQHEPASRRFSC